MKTDVVQGGAASGIADGAGDVGGAARDKVLGGFLIAHSDLEPLVAAQVIGDPALATFVLATDPVAEELPLVGVSLLLDVFVVHEMAAVAAGDGRIGGDGFKAQIEARDSGNVREIDAGPPGGATGSVDGRDIVMHL